MTTFEVTQTAASKVQVQGWSSGALQKTDYILPVHVPPEALKTRSN